MKRKPPPPKQTVSAPLHIPSPFLIATLLPLALYWYTGAPSVTLVDAGEFVTALRTLGIPHPPGVPTYVLLGHLFTLLPWSADFARRATLFSTVCAALACGVSYRITRELLPEIEDGMALAGALAFGFSLSLWSWGVVTEVYALNILLLCLVFLLAARGRWASTALVAGLALGVHHATILFALPAATFLLWIRRRPGLREIASATGAGLLGLCVYAYLPLRAAQNPILDWGHPATRESFWWHLSGKQYQASVLGGSVFPQIGKFFLLWFRQTTPVGFLLICVGLALLWRRNRIIFWFTALVIALNLALVWITGLGGPDIAGYYLPVFLTGSWCFAMGVTALAEWLRWSQRLMLASIFIVVAAAIPLHFSDNNHHDDRVGALFVENTLRGVEPGSLILTSDWNFYAPWMGRRYGDGFRPDVAVVDTNMLHHSWYLPTFQRTYPDLARAAAPEIAAYIPMLDRQEHGQPVEASAMDSAFAAMVRKMIQSKLDAKLQVYYTLKMETDFLPDRSTVPQGLLYRYGEGAEDVELDLSGLLPADSGPDLGESGDLVRKNYAAMFTLRGAYLANVGNFGGAREKLDLALRLDPGHAEARRILQIISGR